MKARSIWAVAAGAIGVVVNWNRSLGPRWYPISLVVLALPQAWAGAELLELQGSRRELEA